MNWDTDRIYCYEERGRWYYFTSPDGIGKIFYNCQSDAQEETGLTSVVYLLGVPND